MYTATLKSKTINKEARRLTTVVTISDGTNTHDITFQFSLNSSVDDVKRTVQKYMDELAAGDALGSAAELDEGVSISYTPNTPAEPTQAEIDKKTWYENWGKLQFADQLIAAGVLTGAETAVTTLRNKVRDTFDVTYV